MTSERCQCSVTKAGGYYAGLCRRPAGHLGQHRLRPTKADRERERALSTSPDPRGVLRFEIEPAQRGRGFFGVYWWSNDPTRHHCCGRVHTSHAAATKCATRAQ